jgi:hypothetical protein
MPKVSITYKIDGKVATMERRYADVLVKIGAAVYSDPEEPKRRGRKKREEAQ